MDITLKPVFLRFEPEYDHLWETMRQIRNSCTDGLTRNREQITKDQQATYKEKCRTNPYVRHYLYMDNGVYVGYSRIEAGEDGNIYPSIGVAAWERGKGYGWQIGALVLLAAGGTCAGELLESNTAVKKIDFSLGWRRADAATSPYGTPVWCPWPPPSVKINKVTPPEKMQALQACLDEIVRYHEYKTEGDGDGLEEGDRGEGR